DVCNDAALAGTLFPRRGCCRGAWVFVRILGSRRCILRELVLQLALGLGSVRRRLLRLVFGLWTVRQILLRQAGQNTQKKTGHQPGMPKDQPEHQSLLPLMNAPGAGTCTARSTRVLTPL